MYLLISIKLQVMWKPFIYPVNMCLLMPYISVFMLVAEYTCIATNKTDKVPAFLYSTWTEIINRKAYELQA